jgi:histidinol-phosphate aminotransferase
MTSKLNTLIRAHYRTLQGYVSAGMEAAKTAEKTFMNANENPFTLPGLENFNRYPEPQSPALLAAYAKLYGVEPENIVATRGADEAIVVLTDLFCEPHKDAVLLCPPTFGMYARDANAMPANIINVHLKKENGTYALDVDAIIKAATDKNNNIKLIFLCSPNNPTGTSFNCEDMLKICKAVENHAAVIIDETYIEFAKAKGLTSALASHPNLVMLRTLSKSYALAGMRMGTIICNDADFIALIKAKCLDAYPLPRASIDAALKVMEPSILKIAAENRAKLLAERDRLHTAFSASKMVKYIYPSDANFLLIEMEDAKKFCDYCAMNNIILRDFSDKPLTENCIRISPGLPEENDRLINLLQKFH